MRRLLCLLVVAVSASAAAAPAAHAQSPCPDAGFEAFQCGIVQVPLDRTGAVPGVIDLFLRRLPTPSGARTRTAFVALAGGPGQAATPGAVSFATALAPALNDRDLIVLDQRGTGRSGRLQCGALLTGRTTVSSITRCANEIGPRRGSFRTADSVDDLEAIRQTLGYEQLAFYGVSYGTKVALDYAAKYPNRVERLVLDSIVPPEGPDPLQRSSFRRVRGVLGELCANGQCSRITSSTVRDIRTLIRRGRDVRGTVVSSSGRKSSLRVAPELLYDILVAGDLNPAWRAFFPAAVRSAVRGDGTPLARLGVAALAGGRSSSADLQGPSESSVNGTLNIATLCEETRLPWPRTASPSQRVRDARAALAREPGSTWSPFTRATALGSGFLGQCVGWPAQSPPPADPTPLPPVPTLVLNGTADLRTPLPDAQVVAGRIPGAQVIAVPNVGHSVLGGDESGCARAAIAGFFNGQGATPCPGARPVAPPTLRPATSVSALGTTGGIRGRVGRTVTAVLRTQQDVLNQAFGESLSGARSKFGGLRGGTVRITREALTLRNVVVIPGVSVSGTIPAQGNATFRVRGRRGAASGTLTISAANVITGRLGGRRINLVPRASAASVTRPKQVPYPDLVRLAR
jgi:pimeloyl-ACP methyl ester carboxylesterase